MSSESTYHMYQNIHVTDKDFVFSPTLHKSFIFANSRDDQFVAIFPLGSKSRSSLFIKCNPFNVYFYQCPYKTW